MMKRIFIIFLAILLTAVIFAQTPKKMSYQAVVRNASNTLVTSHAVGMQISILQGSASGTPVYVETHAPNTNANGLVNIQIGGGTVINGNFATIDWKTGIFFIKTETDPTGGSNYTVTGTSQLLSVPYALHSKTAESITGTIIETDPIYSASQAVHITAGDITKLSNLSGKNTGDQDLSTLATTTSLSTGLAAKVDTVIGKGLSTEDYTTAEKTKLAGLNNADGSETKLTAGTNVTVSGTGTIANPYVIKSIVSMTQIERDALTQIEGVIIYNASTHKPNFYNGTEWMNFDGTSAKTLAIGDSYQGGKIAYILQPGDPGYVVGETHGLIAAPSDQSTGLQWYNGSFSTTGATGSALGTGNANTNTIISNQGAGSYAAQLCADLVLNGYSDWYLPSKDELNKLYINKDVIGGFTETGWCYYWSSTEIDDTTAYAQFFAHGGLGFNGKSGVDHVRAVRAF